MGYKDEALHSILDDLPPYKSDWRSVLFHMLLVVIPLIVSVFLYFEKAYVLCILGVILTLGAIVLAKKILDSEANHAMRNAIISSIYEYEALNNKHR